MASDARRLLDYEACSKIHTLVCEALSDRVDPLILKSEIIPHVPAFARLLSYPPPNGTHRKEVEQGKSFVTNVDEISKINFIANTKFLSDHLHLDEWICANLLQNAMHRSSRTGSAGLNVAIEDFHSTNTLMLETIAVMLKNLSKGYFNEGMRVLLMNIFSEVKGQSKRDGMSFGRKVLNTIISLFNRMTMLVEKGVEPEVPEQKYTGESAVAIGEKVYDMETESLIVQRKTLTDILYSLAINSFLEAEDVLELLTTLRSMTQLEGVATQLVMCFMAALSPKEEQWGCGIPSYFNDANFISKASALFSHSDWKMKELYGVIYYQWCLFLHKTQEMRVSFPQELLFSEDHLESMAAKAIYSGAFKCISQHLLKELVNENMNKDDSMQVDIQTNEQKVQELEKKYFGLIDKDFETYVFQEVEDSIKYFIRSMSGVIRKMKNRDEDIPAKYQSQFFNTSEKTKPTGLPGRRDLEELFKLISHLYKNRPDAGLDFWIPKDQRLFLFLKWGSDTPVVTTIHAYLQMLTSLATGPRSAQQAHDFMTSGSSGFSYQNSSALFSWNSLFKILEAYVSNAYPTTIGNSEFDRNRYQPMEISPQELPLLKAYLGLLRQVVIDSTFARQSLFENPEFHPISTLFTLLAAPVSVDLKASLLETINAFCVPDGFHLPICKEVWLYIQTLQLIPTQKSSGMLSQTQSPKNLDVVNQNIPYELEQLEPRMETYPETIAFITLLTSLIEGCAVPNEITSYPDHLSFLENISYYIAFVIDRIFLKARTRGYIYTDEKWKVNECCMKLISKCLNTYNILGNREQFDNNGQSSPTKVNADFLHPGFFIISRFLSGSKLFDEILYIIRVGVDTVNETSCGSLVNSVIYAFRVIVRSMQLQDTVLNVLLPIYIEQQIHLPIGIHSTLTSIDKLFSFEHDAIIQMALFINCRKSEELCLKAVNILRALSSSSIFTATEKGSTKNINRMVSLLTCSDSFYRILGGFIEHLELDEPEKIIIHDELEPNRFSEKSSIQIESIRSTILDFFLENLTDDSAFPAVSHIFLGFDTSKAVVARSDIPDPDSSETKPNCLHNILEFMRVSISQSNLGSEKQFSYLFPNLAEKSMNILYLLAAKHPTSIPLLRFLRHREDFVFKRINSLLNDFKLVEHAMTDFQSNSATQEGNEDYDRYLSLLHEKIWLLKLYGLELHVTSNAGQRFYVQKLLQPLYALQILDLEKEDQGNSPFFQSSNQNSFKAEQSSSIMVEMLNHLDKLDIDLNQNNAVKLFYFKQIDLPSFRMHNERGFLVYNIKALHNEMSAYQSRLEKEGALTTQGQKALIKDEMTSILKSLLIENQRQVIRCTKLKALESWKELVSLTILQCLRMLPTEIKESFLVRLLMVILPKATSEQCESQVMQYYCELSVLIMSKLKEERNLHIDAGLPIPIEVFNEVLKLVFKLITKEDLIVDIRGQLYAVLGMMLQMLTQPGYDIPPKAQEIRAHGQSAFLDLLRAAGDKVVSELFRDTTERGNQWKAIVLDTLSDIYHLTDPEAHGRFLKCLIDRNFFRQVLASLRKSNEQLKEVLQEENASLFELYMYQSTMSFLLCISQKKDGAKLIVEAGIFDSFAEFNCLDCLPDINLAQFEYGVDFTQLFERYHDIIVPVFELILSISSILGKTNMDIFKKLIHFVAAHQNIICNILKDAIPKITISSLERLKLVIQLLGLLGKNRILMEKVISSPGMGSVHTLMAQLMKKYSTEELWLPKLAPSNDTERGKNETKCLGITVSTIFCEEAKLLVGEICRGLLNYFEIATNPVQDDGNILDYKPIFTHHLSSAKELSRRKDFASLSLGTLCIYIKSCINEVGRYTKELEGCYKKQKSVDSMTIAELNEIASSCPGFHLDLTIVQKQKLALLELGALFNWNLKRAKSLKYSIEQSLVLLWRHLHYYISATSSSFPEGSKQVIPSHVDQEKLQAETQSIVIPLIIQLQKCDMSMMYLGSKENSLGFIELLTRRLRDLISKGSVNVALAKQDVGPSNLVFQSKPLAPSISSPLQNQPFSSERYPTSQGSIFSERHPISQELAPPFRERSTINDSAMNMTQAPPSFIPQTPGYSQKTYMGEDNPNLSSILSRFGVKTMDNSSSLFNNTTGRNPQTSFNQTTEANESYSRHHPSFNSFENPFRSDS